MKVRRQKEIEEEVKVRIERDKIERRSFYSDQVRVRTADLFMPARKQKEEALRKQLVEEILERDKIDRLKDVPAAVDEALRKRLEKEK